VSRQRLALVLVTVLVSAVIGFALGWAASPDSANAAATGNAEVVKQLKKLNMQMRMLNARTGDTQTTQGTVRGLLTIICDYTAPIDCKPH
jgi:hypothetical protein